MRPETRTHNFYVPFQRLWFALPRYIIKKNYRRDTDETGYNMRLKPFLGIIIFIREGEAIPFAWWKKIIWKNK